MRIPGIAGLILTLGMYTGVHSSCLYGQTPAVSSSNLPEWIFNLSDSDSSDYYAIGISDPGMNRESALSQAKIRAVSLLYLSRGFRYNKVFESYKSQTRDVKFSAKNSIYTVLSCRFDTSDIIVRKLYYSDLDECFVLVSSPAADFAKTGKQFFLEASLVSFMIEGNQALNYGLMEFKISNSRDETIHFYSKYFLDTRIEISSGTSKKDITGNTMKYGYRNQNETLLQTGEKYTSEYLGYSFWDGYLTSVIRGAAFSFNSDTGTSSISKNGDTKTQSLNRVMVDEYYQIHISNIAVKDNRLNTLIKIKEINE